MIWSFDVDISTHDDVRDGRLDLWTSRVYVAADDHIEASLTALADGCGARDADVPLREVLTMADRYYDVKVRAPGGEPLTYLIQAPSDLDAKSRAKTEHAASAGVPRDDIEVVSVEEVEPGA